MKNKSSITIKDSKDIKNVFIQVNLKNNTTLVLSSFSSWENLAFIMEALSVTVEKCAQEGIDKKYIYKTIQKYLMQVLGNYEVVKNSKNKED